MIRRLVLLGVVACGLAVGTTPLAAQGLTTGAVTGIVTDEAGAPLASAQVQVINRSTGSSTGVLTRENGRYLIQGLEVGGPYSVIFTMIGYQQREVQGIQIRLSEATRVDARMGVQAVAIEQLEVTVGRTADFTPTRQGVTVAISDTLVHRVPTFSRDFVDLVKLAPQVTFSGGGAASGAGAYNRYNTITIDGSNQSDRFNLNSSAGVPGGASNGKIISMDAVKEMRVMFTPTDVRQGNFTGMSVNAVTKNGTNDLHGGALFTYRSNDDLAGFNLVGEPLRVNQFTVKQYGFNVGGPIIKDRLHFFVAPEWQERTRPASGPYYTSSGTAGESPAVPLDSLKRIADIMKTKYGFDVGSTEPINVKNPLANLFGRLDLRLNANHRVVLRQLYNKADDDAFSRTTGTFNASPLVQNSGFRLTSNEFTGATRNWSTVAQLFSTLGAKQNELMIGYNKIDNTRDVPVQAPETAVGVNVGGTTRAVTFGTEQFSPGNAIREKIVEVVDNLTIPMGAHTFTVGGRLDHSVMFDEFAQRSYGVYVFPTIAALNAGQPTGYAVGYANSGNPADIPVEPRFQTFSLYGQDQWAVNDKVTLTAGLRADMPRFVDAPPQNDTITKLAGLAGLTLRTDVKPKTRVLWSPRLGINIDPTRDGKNQIRAGVGIYSGPPPFVMLVNAYQNSGLGLVTLSCTGALTPAFTLDVTKLPKACQGQPVPGPLQAGTAGINVTDPNFKYPQYFGLSGGFDRQLPYAMVLTVEGLYRRAINGVLIRDLNLKGPRMVSGAPYTDRYGYVLYADTISATGAVTNVNQRYITTVRNVAFSEGIIQVTNQSKDYNWSLSAQLNKRFSQSLEGTVAYTRMMSKDVQSLTSDRAISNWRNGRQLSEAHENLLLSPSVFSRPNRLLAYGTWTAPWGFTDLTAYYERSSGLAITYVVNGDMNGDGYAGNEPIYVPKNALDPSEIRIGTGTGAAFVQNTVAAQAFENFIKAQKCLSEQRGTILKRDSCRTPDQTRLDVSLRQGIPQIKSQQVSLQLDVFNFLNFLNKDWGQIRLPTLSPTFPDQRALTLVGRPAGALNSAIPTFSFDNRLYQTDATKGTIGDPLPFEQRTSSVYQIQLTLRYAF